MVVLAVGVLSSLGEIVEDRVWCVGFWAGSVRGLSPKQSRHDEALDRAARQLHSRILSAITNEAVWAGIVGNSTGWKRNRNINSRVRVISQRTG